LRKLLQRNGVVTLHVPLTPKPEKPKKASVLIAEKSLVPLNNLKFILESFQALFPY